MFDTAGAVPGGGGPPVTPQGILVHVIAEAHRPAGHAGMVRELIDGAAGLRAGNDNLAPGGIEWWAEYRERLERVGRNLASMAARSCATACGRSEEASTASRCACGVPAMVRSQQETPSVFRTPPPLRRGA